MDVGETRRARQRRELLVEVEAEARRQLVEAGPKGVSIRALARAVGLSPASLYTYFTSLDDVFTMLLLGSYRRLANATAAAAAAFAGDPPADAAFAAILAYRRWALDHRGEFNLIFSDQLPGYEAPPGGPTVAAQIAVFQPIIDALADLAPPDPEFSEAQLAAYVWAAFHGIVTLEVNHHVDWVEGTEAVHEMAVRKAFASVGLPSPSPDLGTKFQGWLDSGEPTAPG